MHCTVTAILYIKNIPTQREFKLLTKCIGSSVNVVV